MQVTIKPIEASLARDTQLLQRIIPSRLGKDPFCKVYLGVSMNRSSTCKDGGCNPHWNDTFNFTVTNDPMLRVQVWDNDTCEDDMVGTGSFNLGQFLRRGMDTTIWVDLYNKNHSVGKIGLGLMFSRGNMGMNAGTCNGGWQNSPNKFCL